MNCHELDFSPIKATERFNRAELVFGKNVLTKIVMFVLYILGAKRNAVAKFLGIPDESAKTSLRVLFRDGVSAFQDRRQSNGQNMPKTVRNKSEISVHSDGQFVVINFGPNMSSLKLPVSHKIQVRTVLLSFVKAGLLRTSQVASILGISTAHCRELAGKLANDDVDLVIIDKRQGQKSDYRVGSEKKAQIIQHFAARSVTGHSTSSDVLAEIINEKSEVSLSPRTIRWHINKLGLAGIKKTLPQLVNTLKKTADDAS
jgi:hypothetical protein